MTHRDARLRSNIAESSGVRELLWAIHEDSQTWRSALQPRMSWLAYLERDDVCTGVGRIRRFRDQVQGRGGEVAKRAEVYTVGLRLGTE